MFGITQTQREEKRVKEFKDEGFDDVEIIESGVSASMQLSYAEEFYNFLSKHPDSAAYIKHNGTQVKRKREDVPLGYSLILACVTSQNV